MIILTYEEAERLKTLFSHKVDNVQAETINLIIEKVIELGALIIRATPPHSSQSLALTHLEEVGIRTIQSIALQGEILIPVNVEVSLPKTDDFRGV